MDLDSGPGLIFRYFPDFSERQRQQITFLESFYREWNLRINLVSRKDLDNLYERHVLHALSIALYTDFPDASLVLDAGTGGGFPGVPLAIRYPQVQFVLADSVGKKIRTVARLVRALELDNVEIVHSRVEDIHRGFDFITARAVAPLPAFCAWVQPVLRTSAYGSGGILYLKGGDVEEELKAVPLHARVTDLSTYFDHAFFETKKLVHLY